MSGAPLSGVRVLELGNMYAAPTAGRMLRDFGADVVKVEDPAAGDYARQWTPQKDGLSLGFAQDPCRAGPVISVSQGAAALHEDFEPQGIDLAWVELEHVARRARDDVSGRHAERLSQPRHDHT